MRLNKNILIYPLICATLFSFGSQSISATDIYSNLSLSEKNKIIEKKMEYAKTDPAYIPFVLTSAGLFSNQTVAGSLMVQETVVGDITSSFMACGHYQAGSIMVRILSFNLDALAPDFWKNSLSKALASRKACGFFDNPIEITGDTNERA